MYYKTVKPEKIFAPYEDKDSVIRLFCHHCGCLYEINEEYAQICASFIDKELDLITKRRGAYFEIDGCGVCLKQTTTVELKYVVVQ